MVQKDMTFLYFDVALYHLILILAFLKHLFQVLPQLLNHLDTDSLNGGIDFGTLLVFTCSDNCTPSTSYVQEFVWKQDFSDTHIKFK